MSDDDYDLDDDNIEDEEELDEGGKAIGSDAVADDDADDTSAEDLAAAAASAHSSLAARNKVREAMQSEIDAFLAKGGKIQQVDDNVMADPPKKPTSNYGSRPI